MESNDSKKQINTTKSIYGDFMHHIWQEASGGRRDVTPSAIPWWTTRQVYVTNFFNVPLRLEQFLFFGLLICIDSFLFIFTFLPIRCFMAILTWLGSLVRPRRWSLSSLQHFDLARGSIFILSYFLLNTLDGSYLYHFIRGQASLKLYVIFNLIEIFDKLCCSFGQDIFDYLFATMLPKALGVDSGAVATWRRATRKIGAYFGTVVYTALHALLLFVKVVTLNVSVNAYNNSLLTLLVSNNFAELKGIVFKSFKTENVFQIACSDTVERFQLLVFISIICVHNLNDLSWQLSQDTLWNIAYIIGIVAGMEIIVDWLKHAFITRFNKMQSSIFQHFERIIAVAVIQQDDVPDSCYTTSKRIGFVSLPLACVVFRVFVGVAPIAGLWGFLWTFALWGTLVIAKFLTSLIVLSMSVSILGRTSTAFKSEKLANTFAYDKIE